MNDFKEAMKAKDEVKKNTINLTRAAIKQIEVDTRKDVTDEDIVGIIAKQVKMRKEALSDFEKAGRTDLLETYNKEIEILQKYLPEMMSFEDIETIVEKIALESSIEKDKSNMGQLMKLVITELKGKAEGNDVKKAVMAYLN